MNYSNPRKSNTFFNYTFKTLNVSKVDLDVNTAASVIFEVESGVHEIGEITGSGTTQIDSGATLVVEKFCQDILNVASGGKLVIHPTHLGPLGGKTVAVPEPCAIVMLAWAFAWLALIRPLKGRKGK